MKLVSGLGFGKRIPNFTPLRFGNGGSARKQYEDAILKAAELANTMADTKTKEMILRDLAAISNIHSNDKNYRRWAELLNAEVANQLKQIWPCLTTIKREAQA